MQAQFLKQLQPGDGCGKLCRFNLEPRVMKRFAAETIGTFGLVFAGTGAVVINEVSGGAIARRCGGSLPGSPMSGRDSGQRGVALAFSPKQAARRDFAGRF